MICKALTEFHCAGSHPAEDNKHTVFPALILRCFSSVLCSPSGRRVLCSWMETIHLCYSTAGFLSGSSLTLLELYKQKYQCCRTKSLGRKALAFCSLEVHRSKEEILVFYNLSSESMPRIFIGPFASEFAKGPTFSLKISNLIF